MKNQSPSQVAIVYRATSKESNVATNTYTVLKARRLKNRFYGHRSSMENRNPENQTLSTHICGHSKIKDKITESNGI